MNYEKFRKSPIINLKTSKVIQEARQCSERRKKLPEFFSVSNYTISVIRQQSVKSTTHNHN